jgi:hypothetical protein
MAWLGECDGGCQTAESTTYDEDVEFWHIANYEYPDNRKRQTVSKVESFDLCWTEDDSDWLIAFQ